MPLSRAARDYMDSEVAKAGKEPCAPLPESVARQLPWLDNKIKALHALEALLDAPDASPRSLEIAYTKHLRVLCAQHTPESEQINIFYAEMNHDPTHEDRLVRVEALQQDVRRIHAMHHRIEASVAPVIASLSNRIQYFSKRDTSGIGRS